MIRTRLLPGLLLLAGISAIAFLLVEIPGFSFLGVLMTGMLLGLIWQAIVGLRPGQQAGVEWSMKALLRFGVILLGSRLDLASLIGIGPAILFGAVLVVGGGVYLVNRLCRALGVTKDLSLALAVGTSICGASAILATASVAQLKREDVGMAVAVISIVGTAAAVLLAVAARILGTDDVLYGMIVGLSLQELGHVLSAGYSLSDEAGDLATTVKMVRVALLAPVLLAIGRLGSGARAAGGPSGGRVRVPGFLIGFFVLAIINSVIDVPAPVLGSVQLLSSIALTVAMVGIGLASNLSLIASLGRQALAAGTLGFLLVGAGALAYGTLIVR